MTTVDVREAGEKGGRARAASLTSERRSEIARTAAQERWTRAGKLVRATHGSLERPLRIADLEIPCFVLEDGRRVLAATGLMTSLDMSTGKRGVVRVAALVQKISRTGRDYKALRESIEGPIHFVTPTGKMALGFEATILPELCEAILAARRDGLLHFNQAHIAERCEILLGGLSRVGIVALVDEATGYQAERERDELQKILAAYVSESLLPWTRRFPDDFFNEMFRLRGWERPIGTKGARGPRYAGKLVRELVYKQLPANVLDDLERKNPSEHGQRKYRHHQFLTNDIGNPHLERQVASVTTLMRASANWGIFKDLFERAFPPKTGYQERFEFSDADEESSGDASSPSAG